MPYFVEVRAAGARPTARGFLAFTLGSLLAVGKGVRHLLSLAFPPPEPAVPSLAARLGYTIAFVAAADFAKYVAHFLQHKVVWLWEFHKVHHSYEVRHWDRNYAVIFSLWDTLFRTAYIPRGREEFRLGIGPESAEFKGVLSLYAYPFLAFARRLRAKLRPAPAAPASSAADSSSPR